MRILIRNVDYARYVDINSVHATNNIVKTQDGMSFVVTLTGELIRPVAGMEVIWARYDTSTNAEISREFAGVVSQVKERDLGSALEYDVTVQSYLRWFDRRVVNGFYQQQAAETTIKQVVDKYCRGFTYTNVIAPPVTAAQYFEYQRPSNAVKIVCDQLGYGWYIDYFRDLHVYKVEAFPSPLTNNLLDLDNDFVNYSDLELTEDAENVWNQFIIRGYKARAPQPFTLYFKGDGTTTQWSLGYRFSSAKGDSLTTIDGANYPVVRDILDGLPGQASDPSKAYVHWTQHQIRFANPPAAGATIAFRGYPLVNKTKFGPNQSSIRYMKALEGGSSDGIYEWAELDKSLTQSTEDTIRGKIELLAVKFGLPTLAGSFTSFTPGWRAGQTFRMSSARRMGGISVDTAFYVYRVTKRWIDPRHSGAKPVQYTIEFADKPYLV